MQNIRSFSNLVLVAGVLFLTAPLCSAQPMTRGDSSPISLASGARVEFHAIPSEALGRPADFSVYLPASYAQSEKVYPVIYFLHGLNNDHSSWTVTRHGNIPALIDELMTAGTSPEMIIVHPVNVPHLATAHQLHSFEMRFEQRCLIGRRHSVCPRAESAHNDGCVAFRQLSKSRASSAFSFKKQ